MKLYTSIVQCSWTVQQLYEPCFRLRVTIHNVYSLVNILQNICLNNVYCEYIQLFQEFKLVLTFDGEI